MTSKNVKIITFLTVILLAIMLTGAVSAIDNTNSTVSTDNTQSTDTIVKNVETTQITDDTQEAVANDNTITKNSDKTALKTEPSALELRNVEPTDDLKAIIESNVNANSLILNLESGQTYTPSGSSDFSTATNDYCTSLTINGNGATIDGENSKSFITIANGFTVTLNNLTIKNMVAQNGGAIKNYGTLTVNNTIFDSNNAIYSTGNKTTVDGGAIFSDGTTTVNNSKFTNNHIIGGVNGAEGAAIHATGALYVYNSDFDANIAEYTDTSSSSNGANGGAIAVVNSISDFIVDNSTFTNNKGRHGGAILVYDSQGRNQGTKKITGSTFTGNQAIYGGAIETYNDLIIEDSTFEENSVKGIGSDNRNPLGGAICVNNLVTAGTAGSLTVKNTSFTKNTAPEASSTGNKQGYGGAIYNSGPDGTIDNCTFTENSAYYGGAYYANTNRTECMDVTITNSNFVENTAHDGAAIWDKHYQSSTTPSTTTIDNCQFTDNVATYSYGNTVIASYSNLVISDTNISDSNRYALNLHLGETAKSVDNVTINGLSNINSFTAMIPTVTVTDYAQLVAVSKQINNDYTGTASVTISLEGTDYTETEPIVFENNSCTVTINGNGKTIDANGMQFLTVAEGKTVQLNNLTIANARAANGSAIMNLGTLTVNNGRFENNVATENGGAIYVKAGTNAKLTVRKTSFIDNNAINGGALFTSIGSTITLEDTNFTSNNATYGGAIHTYNTTLTLTRVNFNQNNATYGGAICAYNTTKTTAKNTNFTANTADSQGGAVWNDHGSVLTTNNTNFTNNKAGVSGGAVWNRYSNITANNTQFVNNEAGSGGAIYSSVGTVVANQSTFNTNKATSDIGKGGAIWTDDEISIIKSEFTENTAVVDGGAIYTGFSSRSFDPTFAGYNINITESTFDSNTAGSQGGAIYTTYITNITDSNFTANKAANGGAIFITPDEFADFAGVEYSDVTINNVTFDANEALYNGGAIYSNGTLNVNDSTFTNNKMTTHQAAGRNDYGGGAICAFKELNVNNSVFTENLAAHNDVEPRGDGGVAGAILVLNNSQVVSITSSNFTANSGRHGGAITINNNDVVNTNKVTIDNNNFVENTALYGGAIDTYQQVNITNNNFTKNVITGQGSGERVPMGAAICINQGNDEYTVIVQNNNFIENEAKDNGVSGVIHTQNGTTLTSSNNLYENNKATDTGVVTVFDKATFTNDTFIGNTADYTGVFTNYNDLTIDNCTFENNEGNGYGDVLYEFSESTITDSIFITQNPDYDLVKPYNQLTATNNTVNNVEIDEGLIIKKDVIMTITNATGYVDDEATITVELVDEDGEEVAFGFVQFDDGTEVTEVEITGSQATYTVTLTQVGVEEITITFADNIKYNEVTDTGNFTTIYKPATITVDELIEADAKEDIEITFDVTSEGSEVEEGTVTLKVVSEDGTPLIGVPDQTVDLSTEDWMFTLNLEAGTYYYNLSYDGGKYQADNVTVKVVVSPKDAVITMQEDNIIAYPEEEVIIEVSVTDLERNPINQGTVTITRDDDVIVGEADVEDGIAQIAYTASIDDLGDYTLTVTYDDVSYIAEDYTDAYLSVEQISIYVDVEEAEGYIGIPTTITANFETADEETLPVGVEVVFMFGDEELNRTVVDENGVATIEYIFDEADEYLVTIEFADLPAKYAVEDITPNTVVITAIPAIIRADPMSIETLIGESVDIDITITADIPDAEDISEGYIIVTDSQGKQIAREAINDGMIPTLTIDTTKLGSNIYTVSYESTGQYEAEDITFEIMVDNVDTTLEFETIPDLTLGQTVNITVNVIAADNSIINEGTVEFTDKDGNPISQQYVVNVVDGKATISYTANKVGSITIIAKYADSMLYAENQINTTIKTSKAATTLTIDPITAVVGQTITLTARIENANDYLDINEGKVAFKVNGKTIKDENGKVIYAKVEDGVATLEYEVPESWSTKEITISAVYSGSTNYNSSRGETVVEMSSGEPSIVITSDETFTKDTVKTFTVELKDGNTPINQGRVVFKINGKTLKDANGKVIYVDVVNGIASLNFNINATYYKTSSWTLKAVFISTEYERLEATQQLQLAA